MSGFRTVDDSIRQALPMRGKSSRFDAEIRAVLDGQTIFIPGAKFADGTVNGIRTMVSNRSKRTKHLVSRTAFVDGESGVVMWAEAVPA